jgi:hypothetical protein
MSRSVSARVAACMVACAILAVPAGPARAASGTPKVVLIVLENKEYSDVVGNASAPYLNSLLDDGMLFTDYHALLKGSGPNYRAMTAGVTNIPQPPPANVFRSLDLAGATWTELEESMTGNCGATDNAKVPGSTDHLYTIAHDPARDWRGNESCSTNDVPLRSDAQLSGLPDFTFIIPNQCDDMHTFAKGGSCPGYYGPVTGGDFVKIGDNWLAHVVPLVMSDPDATVIITFDEGALTVDTQHVLALELGAGVTPGTVDGAHYDHYGLLAGLYRAYGLGVAPNGGATATPLPIAPDVAPTLDVGVAGPGSVVSAPSGISCGPGTSGPCSATFSGGSSVTLTASPDDGTTFDGWSGDCSGTGDCVVSMDGTKHVTATFGPLFALTVDPPANGTVTSDVAGIDCPSACSHDFASGRIVTLMPHADAGYAFDSWGGDCPDTQATTCTVTMDAARSASATFVQAPQDAITVAVAGSGQGSVTSDVGGIDCPGACSASVDDGSTVGLTAHAGTNAVFSGWSGSCSGSASTCSLTLSGRASVTATFEPLQTLDDADPAVGYDGWGVVIDGSAQGGRYRVSGAANDKATWKSAKTTSVTWITHVGPDAGKATVTIDGSSKGTVDLYAASPGRQSETFGGLMSKVHTVIVKVTGTRNASSSGSEVAVDAFSSGGAATPESDPGVKYDTWVGATSGHALGGSYRSSATKSATVTVGFTGSEIDWITSKGPAFGRASVSIDGTSMGTVDLYRASQVWQTSIPFSDLGAGPHTMVIHVLAQKASASSGKKVVVDGFEIRA